VAQIRKQTSAAVYGLIVERIGAAVKLKENVEVVNRNL